MPMRILVAPDKFKGALDAAQAAAAIAAGIRDERPDAEVDLCPLGDGGDGTGPILAAALDADVQMCEVRDPMFRLRMARWWQQSDRRLAIVELAEASGLRLLTANEKEPLHATTYGTGQLLYKAWASGADEILLAVGGSATVDGGAGCLQALGWKLFDATGRQLPEGIGGGALERVAQLLPPHRPCSAKLTILADVANPLLGSSGAAAVFAPQKGATPLMAHELERGLRHWVEVLNATADHHPIQGENQPMLGAAGGVAAALVSAIGATCQSGFAVVAQAVRLPARLRNVDLCITGEGRLDAQTLQGKVVSGVAQACRLAGAPCVALAGRVQPSAGGSDRDLAAQLGLTGLSAITPADMPQDAALASTAENLRKAAAQVIREMPSR